MITEAKRLLPNKDKAFYFFYYGWYMVIFMGLFVFANLTTYFNMSFPFLHTTFALESMVLSLAIAYKMKVLEDERVVQQSLLLQQSRLASMGEMVSTIAHQWRQPLTHLSYIFMNMKKKADNPDFVKSKLKEGKSQIEYMSQTIEHFSNFYNPSKEKKEFSSVHGATKLLKNTTVPMSSVNSDSNKILEFKKVISDINNKKQLIKDKKLDLSEYKNIHRIHLKDLKEQVSKQKHFGWFFAIILFPIWNNFPIHWPPWILMRWLTT